MKNPITWQDIEAQLDSLTPVDGGFSQAHRGLISLPDGRQLFVKIGVDDNTRQWAHKEIAVYRYLKRQSYGMVPELVTWNADETAFALEALTPEDGWDWSETWTPDRLGVTLKAMDELAALKPEGEDWMDMGMLALDESRDGWAALGQSAEHRQALLKKLESAGYREMAATLDFAEEAAKSAGVVFRTDTLVHYDVRADNCAWNPRTQQVKLVDWNWTQYGDVRFDSAAMLTHVQRLGLDASTSERLDSDALQWLAGFWFNAAATPIWPGGPEHLRDFQLQAGVTALNLARKV